MSVVEEWLTRDLLIECEIYMDENYVDTMFAVGNENLTSEEVSKGVMSYLRHKEIGKCDDITHGFITVNYLKLLI